MAQRRKKRQERKAQVKENRYMAIMTTEYEATISRATRRDCLHWYGFIADPDLPVWKNVVNAIGDMHPRQYFNRPNNMAYHNLCTCLTPPPGTASLLGLGHKYCIERPKPFTELRSGVHRFRRAVRLKDYLKQHELGNSNEDYNSKLYVKSLWNPPHADGNKELRMIDFATRLECEGARVKKRHPRTNLTPQQYAVLHTIRADRRFMVCLTDKNLGPAILERDVYIQRVFVDHLDKTATYEHLPPNRAKELMQQTKQQLIALVERHQKALPHHERVYFKRSFAESHRTPQFYLTLKVHKTPWATRPVVACVGSFNEVFSKWLDIQMKRLLPLSQTYLKDSYQVLDELKALGQLPANARLFTADAHSMYTNIDTKHALTIFKQWLQVFPDEIPTDFPTDLFLSVLELVMTRNVFQFDDTYWLQKDGTAMGTSTACMYATLYYAFHERLHILPRFGQHLLYLKRFIDDMIGIWIGPATEWSDFNSTLDEFGSLTWDVSNLATNAIFLDLNIRIDPETRRIATKTYQKPMNLFLYIPPTSAHTPGVLKSTILGNLRRFWCQNTNRQDYVQVAKQFADRLVARGHDPTNIRNLSMEAAAVIDSEMSNGTHHKCVHPSAPRNTIFFHAEYHPRGIA